MMNNEYCRYIHTYSELEGLQHAHSLVYCGALSAQGVVMELLRYLCENSVGLEQWLEVLADVGQSYELLENAGTAGTIPDFAGDNLDFCAICRF